MFEFISELISKISIIDEKYNAEVAKIEAAEKAAMDRVKAEEARLQADHKAKMAAMKAEHKAKMAAIKASRSSYSPETEEALRKHKELTARFEALMSKRTAC